MEQRQSDDPVKSPVIQEIIMSNRIGAIAVELAKRLNIAPEKALQLFYCALPSFSPRDVFE